MKEIPEEVKKDVRSVLISNPKGVPFKEFTKDYWNLLGKPVPYTKLGYFSLGAFFEAMPDVARLEHDPKTKGQKCFAVADSELFLPSALKKGVRQQTSVVKNKVPFEQMTQRQQWEALLTPNLRGQYALCFFKSPGISREEVSEEFAKAGEVAEVSITHKYVFVRYCSMEETLRAMEMYKKKYSVWVPEEKMNPKHVVKKQDMFKKPKTYNKGAKANPDGGEDLVDIYVGAIPPDIHQSRILELLGDIKEYGNRDMKKADKSDGRVRYMFIQVKKDRAEEAVFRLHHTDVGGHCIIAQMAFMSQDVVDKKTLNEDDFFKSIVKGHQGVLTDLNFENRDSGDEDEFMDMPPLELAPLVSDPPPLVLADGLPHLEPALPSLEPAPPLLEPAPPLLEPAPPLLQPAPPLLEPAPPLLEPAPPLLEPAPPLLEPAPPLLQLASTQRKKPVQNGVKDVHNGVKDSSSDSSSASIERAKKHARSNGAPNRKQMSLLGDHPYTHTPPGTNMNSDTSNRFHNQRFHAPNQPNRFHGPMHPHGQMNGNGLFPCPRPPMQIHPALRPPTFTPGNLGPMMPNFSQGTVIGRGALLRVSAPHPNYDMDRQLGASLQPGAGDNSNCSVDRNASTSLTGGLASQSEKELLASWPDGTCLVHLLNFPYGARWHDLKDHFQDCHPRKITMDKNTPNGRTHALMFLPSPEDAKRALTRNGSMYNDRKLFVYLSPDSKITVPANSTIHVAVDSAQIGDNLQVTRKASVDFKRDVVYTSNESAPESIEGRLIRSLHVAMNVCLSQRHLPSASDLGGEDIMIMIHCVVDETYAWGQILDQSTKADLAWLGEAAVTMQEPENQMPYRKGSPTCCAMYDGEYFRGCVLGEVGGKLEVFAIDYGNTLLLSKDDVSDLPPKFWEVPALGRPLKIIESVVDDLYQLESTNVVARVLNSKDNILYIKVIDLV